MAEIKIVLDKNHAEAEREAAKRMAEIKGLSVSTMMRRILKTLYRRKVKGFDPDLFTDIHPGGNAGHSPECTCVVCQSNSKKGDKTDD